MTTRQAVVGKWYTSLKKPPFNPPNWVFPVVWTLMYALMGIASVLIVKQGGGFFTKENRLALTLYLIQLALNIAWNPLFFLTQRIALAGVWLVSLDIVIGVTIWKFFALDRTAGWLMVPYFAWCLFATLLNYSIWLLNYDVSDAPTNGTMSASTALKREMSGSGYQAVD